MGKRKLIDTPEMMWDLFTRYKLSVKENPVLVEDYVGKDADKVERQRERPLTMEGFECFVMDNSAITYPDLSAYFDGKNESYKNYFHICSRIKREIRKDQIEGGMAGIYNPSITQRLNGLVEKSENESKHVVTASITGMTIL